MTRFIKLSRARGTILAGLVMSLLFAGAMTAIAAEVSTAPSASPGSDITINGSVDLVGLEQVDLCWDAPRCDNLATVQLGLLQTTYTVTVTVPGSAGAGGHDIYACTDLRGCVSTSIEVVVPPPPTTTTTSTTTTTTTPTPTTTTTTTTAPANVASTLPTSTTTTTSPAAAAPNLPATTTTTTAPTSTVSSQVEAVAARSEGSDLPKQQDQGVTPPPTTTSSTVYQPPVVAAAPLPTPPETTRPTNNPSAQDVAAVELTLPQAPVGWTIDWSVLVWAGALLVVVIITCRLMIWSLSKGHSL